MLGFKRSGKINSRSKLVIENYHIEVLLFNLDLNYIKELGEVWLLPWKNFHPIFELNKYNLIPPLFTQLLWNDNSSLRVIFLTITIKITIYPRTINSKIWFLVS